MSLVYVLLLYGSLHGGVVGAVIYTALEDCERAATAYKGAPHIKKAECRPAAHGE